MTSPARLADRAADHLQAARHYHRPAVAGWVTLAAAAGSLTVPSLVPFTVAAAAYTIVLLALRARVSTKLEREVAALVAAYGTDTAAAVCALPLPWWSQVPRQLDPAAGFAFLVAVARVHAVAAPCTGGHPPMCRHRTPAALADGTWVAQVIALPAELGLMAVTRPRESQ